MSCMVTTVIEWVPYPKFRWFKLGSGALNVPTAYHLVDVDRLYLALSITRGSGALLRRLACGPMAIVLRSYIEHIAHVPNSYRISQSLNPLVLCVPADLPARRQSHRLTVI